MVTMILHALDMQIAAGLNLFGEINIISKLFMVVVLINGFTVINLIFSFCGDVHQTSEKCLIMLRAKLGKNDMVGKVTYWQLKRYRKILRTLPNVKISFGEMNYIEKLTPVIFQHFTAARLIDCLLLSKAF